MPAATEPPEAKTEQEELLWQALTEHIMLERQKKKEEQEAEVEEERLRKEREARDRQDAMTLGETREQIQLVSIKLEELRNEKQQLFLRLKKVLNEDENRKKQQQQKDCEMFNAMVQPPHPQIFLPPRAPHQQLMQKGGPPLSNPPIKRSRSPSPVQSYWKVGQKHNEVGKRVNEVPRAVLWNKPTYQNAPTPLYFPQESRGQSIIYPHYAPNLNMSLRQGYHVEIPPPQQQQQQQQQQHQQSQQQQQQQAQHQQSQSQKSQQQQSQHMKIDQKSNQNAQVYHINLDQPPPQQQQMVQQHKLHVQHGGGGGGGYHLEMKHDDRKERMVVQHQQQIPNVGHMSDGIVYASLRPGMPPIHSNVMTMAPNQQQVNPKPGGSISQGFPTRGPPGSQGQPQPPPSQPPPQMHYQRHHY